MSALTPDAHRIIEEVAREVAAATTMAGALRNIAGGHWNVGREPGTEMDARQYAREALRVAGLPESWYDA